MGIFIESKNQNMKLFSILALATASQAYTVFEIGKACDEANPCGEQEVCDENSQCACLPGWTPADDKATTCTVFTCEDSLCNGGACKENACDCTNVKDCTAEGAECDAYCSLPAPPPVETTTVALETTTAGNSAEDASAFATLSAVAMAILLA